MAVTGGGRITGAAAFTALVIVASAGHDGWLADADRALFETIRAHRGRAGTAAARFISAFGEPSVIYPGLVIGLIARKAGWQRAGLAGLVVLTGGQARRWLSQVIARPRPPAGAWLTVPEGYSLPSKHTTMAALAAGAYVHALGMRGVPGDTAPILAAALVGASRVYLGVHWPGDVVAGWLFAEGWLRLTGCSQTRKG